MLHGPVRTYHLSSASVTIYLSNRYLQCPVAEAYQEAMSTTDEETVQFRVKLYMSKAVHCGASASCGVCWWADLDVLFARQCRPLRAHELNQLLLVLRPHLGTDRSAAQHQVQHSRCSVLHQDVQDGASDNALIALCKEAQAFL